MKRSEVNPAGHWEGIGHFSYVYFQNKKICQCSQFEIVISPNTRYVVYYSNVSKKLELFDTRLEKTNILSQDYIGYPKTGVWDFHNNKAIIKLEHPNGDSRGDIEISLN